MYFGGEEEEKNDTKAYLFQHINVSKIYDLWCRSRLFFSDVCIVLHTMQLSSERSGWYNTAHNNIFT